MVPEKQSIVLMPIYSLYTIFESDNNRLYRFLMIHLPARLMCCLIFLTECLLTSPEKLAQAKEENLNMHQVLDQTLLELNNL